jgi:hypothetical protein
MTSLLHFVTAGTHTANHFAPFASVTSLIQVTIRQVIQAPIRLRIQHQKQMGRMGSFSSQRHKALSETLQKALE